MSNDTHLLFILPAETKKDGELEINRMPHYCIFGDTINVASAMQKTSEGMTIDKNRLTTKVFYTQKSMVFLMLL